MEGLLMAPMDRGYRSPTILAHNPARYFADVSILEAVKCNCPSENLVDSNLEELYQSLYLTAAKVIEKLNELLKKSVPDGIHSLKAEEWTPEATAGRIVTQVTSLFSVYAKQHPDLEKEELLTNFMNTIRTGVKQGYEEAITILQNLGAFEFDGVKSGVEQTKELIDQKLMEYEAKMRKWLGIEEDETSPTDKVSKTVSTAVLTHGGRHLLDIAA